MLEIRVPVNLHVRFLLSAGTANFAVLTLHGYGSSPEAMLRLTRMSVGDGPHILAMQAPFQHYSGAPGEGEPAYNWGIRQHHAEAVKLHHEMVDQAILTVEQHAGLSPERILLMGFSQPVGLNYRFLGLHPQRVGAVAGLCGGVTKDWETGDYAPNIATPILHISRSEDEFFPASVASGFANRLKHRAQHVEFHLLPGGHKYPSKAKGIFADWIPRVFPGAAAAAGLIDSSGS